MPNVTHAHPPTPADTSDDRPRDDARLHARQLGAFRVHAGVFAGSMVVIFLVNLALDAVAGITGVWWAWWSVLALLGWGLGVTIHGLVVRVARSR